MLELDADHAREVARVPRLVEIKSGLAAIRARLEHAALRGVTRAAVRCESECRRQREMILLVDRRIMRLGVTVVILWKQNRRADVYRLTPECREQLTLDLYVLDPFRVCRHGDGRQHARERQLEVYWIGSVDVHALHIAHEISRRRVPVLSLPLVHVSPDDVSVSAMELRVHVHHRLNVVISRGKLCEREWISGG